MSGFLDAIKADLLDRRLRAAALLALAALVAAIAYAVTGGGGSAPLTPSPAVSPASGPAPAGTITPVAAAPNRNHALSETPSGAATQRRAALRNPFTPLPGAATAASPKGGTSLTGTGNLGSTRTSGGATPTTPSTPQAPAAPKTTYEVSVAMGPLPPGTLPGSAQLTPYQNLKFHQKLPSPSLRLIEFSGVASGGKKVTFTLLGDVIPLRGPATCSPSPIQCQAIELVTGQTEDLEYLPPTGAAQVYELQVVSVAVH